MKKILKLILSTLSIFFFSVVPAYAHVVVKPDTVGISAFQTFTIGVPNEKDSPVVGLRLVIPEGLNYVSPNVKSGWTIEVKKSGEEENSKITEISWEGGSIPVGQRDDFLFSAQVPGNETTLKWRAYQTFQNGDIISWDQKTLSNMSDENKEKMEREGKGPYSETKIINDLKAENTSYDNKSEDNRPTQLSIIAIALSAASIAISLRKK